MDPVATPAMETTDPIDKALPRAISFPAGNDDFRAARNDCARACRQFNDTPEDAPSDIRCKKWLDIVSPNRPSTTPTNTTTLDQTFRDPSLVPVAPFVKPPLHMDYGLRVRVGATTFINRYCMIMDTPVADVVIGERCNVGPHCTIIGVGHPVGVAERTSKRSSTGREVRVGDGVWIGAGVTIMGGVTIGDGAVIGACSLVTRSIPPRALAYGVPAEVVRILDEEDEKDGDKEDGDGEASVQTLEEALKARSRPATPGSTRSTTSSSVECGSEKSKSSTTTTAAGIYGRPSRDRGQQQHLGGVRDSHGLTRAEILALVALAVSFMGCFFFVALLVLTKRESDPPLPRVRDL